MPNFPSSELWNDVVHPLLLSIGSFISSFGPFTLVFLIGFYFVVSSATSEMEAFQANVEKIPGTPYYDTQRTVEQSERVQAVLSDMNGAQKPNVEGIEQVTRDQANENRAERGELRRQNFESAIGKSSQTEPRATDAMLQGFLNLASPLVVVGAIFFLWGIIYFPAASALSGYTRSFTVTINPLVVVETINRLGGKYVRFLLMTTALVLASTVVGVIAGAVLAQFDLTGLGNLRAVAIGVLSGFCLWIVFTCVLGYTIFKNVDRLGDFS